MSDQSIRRVLFSSPQRQEGSLVTKTLMKPKEEVRSITPVSTSTSGKRMRGLLSSFTSVPLKDICEASPVPLPVVAAAAAAAAAKRANSADGKQTVEEMVKAAELVLHSHSFRDGEDQKDVSTPVRRKSVTFAEPIQISENRHSLSTRVAVDPQAAESSARGGEEDSKAFEDIPASDVDPEDRDDSFHRFQKSPVRRFVRRLAAPKGLRSPEDSRASTQHTVDASAGSNGREMGLERIPFINNEKTHVERSTLERNEGLKSQRDAFTSDEKVRTKHTTLTKGQQQHRSGMLDSQPLEEKSVSVNHTLSSGSSLHCKPSQNHSKLEPELSSCSGTQTKPREVSQFPSVDENLKSSSTTDSYTKEPRNNQHTSTRSRRKTRLSEVFKLQKSLETAFWTDSRIIRQQTEVIAISDDDTPVTPRGKHSRTPKNEEGASVSKERDKRPSIKKSDSTLSRSTAMSNISLSDCTTAVQRQESGSPSVAFRTRSKTSRATKSKPQRKPKEPQTLQRISNPEKGAIEKSDKSTEGDQKHNQGDTQDEKQDEPRAVKTPRSSKRKFSVPRHLLDLDTGDWSDGLGSSTKGGRKALKTGMITSPNASNSQKSFSNVEADMDLEYECRGALSTENHSDPLRDLEKVKLSNRMWQNFCEGWAVHNDITERAKPEIDSSALSIYVESPFGCEDLVSAFASDFGLHDKDSDSGKLSKCN
eukprot:TRINITY_DN296_c0_g1_i10.p1 TRINITY_DN296_c0_g1~~TRINITY_DN296_c0_g1_i10.p1  ORF type:complete len:704 (+),score=97.00 TRINITY_DN296_c0_g1_i10:171-2282(+)